MIDFKALLKPFARALSGKKCFICGEQLPEADDGCLFCEDCSKEADGLFSRPCPGCGKPPSECFCAPRPLVCNNINIKVLHIFLYNYHDRLARRIVYALKRRRTDALFTYFSVKASVMLVNALENDIYTRHAELSDCVFTYVPRSPKNVKLYGFDQSELLCKSICKRLGVKEEKLFGHSAYTPDQKLLNATDRATNARRTYKYISDKRLKGKTVVIVDDVITSGNTVRCCVNLAKSKGARDFIIFSVCQSRARVKRENQYE